MQELREKLTMAEENISLIRERQARIEQKVDDGFTTVLIRLDNLCCKEHIEKIHTLEHKVDVEMARIEATHILEMAESKAKALLDTVKLEEKHGGLISDLQGEWKSWRVGVAVAITILTISISILGIVVNAMGNIK